MEHVWTKVEELRVRYELLREDRTPLDVFTFFEVDLGLDPIPFDDLTAKYRVEAAITDLTKPERVVPNCPFTGQVKLSERHNVLVFRVFRVIRGLELPHLDSLKTDF